MLVTPTAALQRAALCGKRKYLIYAQDIHLAHVRARIPSSAKVMSSAQIAPHERLPMRLRLVTVVWGSEFVERFVQLAVPSLMAPGNLPDISRRHDVTYEIYAPADDMQRITSQAAFADLARIVEIQFRPFAETEIDADNPMSHWDVWRWAVEAARKDDVYVILAAPDHIFCRGALQRWTELLEEGYLAIFCTGFQVVAETFTEEIAARFGGGRPIDLSRAELRELMFRHLHPIKISMFRNSPRWIAHPEWHLRAVPGHGLLQRILASHAYAFHPGRIRMNESFCPVEKFDRVAFEPSCFLGAEPLLKYLGLYLRPWRMGDATLSYYGVWADHFMSPVNLRECKLAYEFPIGPVIPEMARRREQLGGDFYVGQMRSSRAVVRFWRGLHDAGLYRAAQWLAAAHLHGRLRRRLSSRNWRTVFVPNDAVFDRLAPGESERLIANGATELIAAMAAHVAPGRHALSPGDRLAEDPGGAIRTMCGQNYSVSQQGTVTITRGPIRVDDIEVYVVDQALGSVALLPSSVANALSSEGYRFRHVMRRLRRRSRARVLAVLQRSPRLFGLVLELREKWITRDTAALLATDQVKDAALVDLDPQALDLYRRALAVHGLAAIRQMYAFYQECVLNGSGVDLAPRALLSNFADTDSDKSAQWLLEAVQRSADFAEAWLELGYLRHAAGDEDAAIDAFGHAQKASLKLPHLRGQPDLRLIAATERAKLMHARGRPADALAALEAAPSRRFAPWGFHFCRARLLIDLGRIEEALAAFEQCLEWRLVGRRFAGFLPRDLADLSVEPGPKAA